MGTPVNVTALRPRPEWNDTYLDYPKDLCIHDLVSEQAGRTPDEIAVVCDSSAMTYAELDHRSDQLARLLRRLNVQPDDRVGVLMERSTRMLVALLAILKAGGAYVPLDRLNPPQRLKMIVEDAAPSVIVTETALTKHIPPCGARTLCLDELGDDGQSDSPEANAASAAHNLAYVIYTSGSTGVPKGVMVQHRNVVNFFYGMDQILGRDSGGVWLAVTSVSFDISVLELFWTLARGFRVVIQSADDYDVPGLIRRHRVTHLQCTPSLARILASETESLNALRPLQKLLIGGEPFPVMLAERLKAVVSGDIYNMYGPTETTIWSTSQLLTGSGGAVPIGRPIANTRIHLLDEAMRPVNIGGIGELFIAGDGVARGYWNREQLTAERFVKEPGDENAGRMYRTGDLARFLPDGAIEYLGRVDFQVKIRGFRIELGEIESALETHPSVGQAVVVARDLEGSPRLEAYFIRAGGHKVSALDLRNHLRGKVPEYMIPSVFAEMPALPLTPNGKIDRNALHPPHQPPPAEVNTPPNHELEQTLAEIWQEVLGVDSINVDTNFFDFGAHSLPITEVNLKLEQRLHRKIPLIDMFQYPTIRLLARHLTSEEARQPGSGDPSKRAEARKRARAHQSSLGARART